jgi:hypothetical protein
MADIYISVDIEADGPIPGVNSMLSLGAAAFDIDGNIIDQWTSNLRPLPGAVSDPDTLDWFQNKNRAAWDAVQIDPKDPAEAMWDYRRFIESLNGNPIFTGYPASYDFMFHHWYLIRFTGKDPCGHRALCVRSLTAGVMKTPFSRAGKGAVPKEWRSTRKHSHVALDDAIEQGETAINVIRASLGKPAIEFGAKSPSP